MSANWSISVLSQYECYDIFISQCNERWHGDQGPGAAGGTFLLSGAAFGGDTWRDSKQLSPRVHVDETLPAENPTPSQAWQNLTCFLSSSHVSWVPYETLHSFTPVLIASSTLLLRYVFQWIIIWTHFLVWSKEVWQGSQNQSVLLTVGGYLRWHCLQNLNG